MCIEFFKWREHMNTYHSKKRIALINRSTGQWSIYPMLTKTQRSIFDFIKAGKTAEQIITSNKGVQGFSKPNVYRIIDMLKNEGINIGFVEIKLLHPFPKELLKKSFSNSKTIIDVEANYTGQLGSIIKQNLEKDPDYYILKYTGRPMTCTELYDTLKKIVNNNAEKREVLTYGA